jgi:glycerol-3-phosphate responsive antiterminator
MYAGQTVVLIIEQFWEGTGGIKPRAIREIEHVLWSAIFDIAGGNVDTKERVQSALAHCEPILSNVDTVTSEWFNRKWRYNFCQS